MGTSTPRHNPKPYDRPCLGGHIAHSNRHDRTVRHDRLTTPAHGASSKQGHDVEPSPSPSASRRGDVSVAIYETSRTRLQEGEGGAAPRLFPPLFFSFLFSLPLSPLYTRSFPGPIKGKVGRPTGESLFGSFRSTSIPLHFHQRLERFFLS
jgi:hypothetical protein